VVSTPNREVPAYELEVVDIPISSIRVLTRLRATSPEKIGDIAESISSVGLLHPVAVSRRGDKYVLLSGHHRMEAFKVLGKDTIPASIRDADELTDQLVEVEENLCRSDLNAIQTAEHIVKREELLEKLGKRASSGENRWTRNGMTNDELARSMGINKRTYQYKKSVANLNPEVKDILGETEYANNLMDMVKLSKENDEVQLEVANLLATGMVSTFKRALVKARCKVFPFNWNEEQLRLKELVGSPKSVMKWTGTSSALSHLCKLVSSDEECRKTKQTGRVLKELEIPNYSQHPDHAAHFINFYSREGDRILDCFSGRGTNLLVGAALGRKVVGYDLSPQNLEAIRSACMEHTGIASDDLVLHHSDGVELAEYADQENFFDLVTTDPPYVLQPENYGSDPRDLCHIKTVDAFNAKLEICLANLKRLIKPSNFKQKLFHPIIFKVGSSRRGPSGLIDMATELEISARKIGLVLHDKVINILDSQWGMVNTSRCIDHRYALKIHETNLVFVKYE